ncbi:MAG: hypothetical protein AB1715_12680 [Acidobacteriota bacterium]
MGIFKIFGQGVRTARAKTRVAIYLWLLNFLFAAIVIAPVYFLLQKEFSRSLLGDRLLSGMELLWLGDLIYKFQNAAPLLIGGLLVAAVLYVLLQIFLTGGIIGRLAAAGEKANLAAFFGDCGRYFWRLFRVFLLFLVSALLIFGVLGRLLSAPFGLWMKNASTEWTTLAASSLRLLVFLLLFSIVRMFFDYVKVSLVVADSRKTLRAALANFSFLGRRFFRAWVLYLLVGALFFVLSAAYLAVAKTLPKPGFFALFLFFLQQAYIVARSWTTILFFSTEYHFLMAHRPLLRQ